LILQADRPEGGALARANRARKRAAYVEIEAQTAPASGLAYVEIEAEKPRPQAGGLRRNRSGKTVSASGRPTSKAKRNTAPARELAYSEIEGENRAR